MHEERGHCYVVLRDAPRAIEALLHAVNINPALPSSWNLLEGLYRMTGDAANAATAASHVATLKRLAPDVVRATSHFSDGELEAAEQIIRAYLLKAGNDVEAMRLLARIGLARDVLDDAEILLEAVLKIAPDYRAARYDYACVLLERHLYKRACEEAEKLLAIDPDHPRLPGAVRQCECRPGRTRSCHHAVPEASAGGSWCGRSAPVAGAFAQDTGTASGIDRGLSSRRGRPSGFRRRVLEPGEPENASLQRRRDRPHAFRGSVAVHEGCRSIPSELRARQGTRRSR
jgi:tetratricopeptide (TPR) repeat protein